MYHKEMPFLNTHFYFFLHSTRLLLYLFHTLSNIKVKNPFFTSFRVFFRLFQYSKDYRCYDASNIGSISVNIAFLEASSYHPLANIHYRIFSRYFIIPLPPISLVLDISSIQVYIGQTHMPPFNSPHHIPSIAIEHPTTIKCMFCEAF